MGNEILLAEDNPADIYLIQLALRRHGVDNPVHVSTDGRDALDAVTRHGATGDALALIILDLNLPRHDGLEILEHIRATKSLNQVPVVVLTSSDSPQDRRVASELGATIYLRKPSCLEEFLGLGGLFQRLLIEPAAAKSTSC